MDQPHKLRGLREKVSGLGLGDPPAIPYMAWFRLLRIRSK
jgi:hypothetical protein